MTSPARTARSIDPKIREAALQAAQAHNMPMGEWLAQALAAAEAAGTDPETTAPAGFASVVEPLDHERLRRLADAIERLSERVELSEQRAALSLLSVDRGVAELGEQLEDTEHSAREETLRLFSALGEVRALHDALHSRLQRMEDDPTAQRAIAALRALETRLDRLSDQLHAGERRSADETAALQAALIAEGEAMRTQAAAETERLNQAIGDIRAAVGGLETGAQALQRRLEEQLAAQAEEAAARRSEAEVLRATIETNAADLGARLEDAKRIADRELAKLAAAVDAPRPLDPAALAEALAPLAEPIAHKAAAAQTLAEAAKLRVGELDARFSALDAVARDAARTHEERIAAIDSRLAQARAALDQRLSAAEARLDAVEGQHQTALERLDNALSELRGEIAQTADRIADADAQGLTEALERTLEDRLRGVRAETAEAMAEARREHGEEIAALAAALRPDEIDGAFAGLNQRLAAAERRHVQTIEAVSVEIKRLTDAIERRLRPIEDRPDGAAGLRREFAQFGDRIEARLAEIEAREDNLKAGLADRIDALAAELRGAALASEERTGARLADALSHIGARLMEVDARAERFRGPLEARMSALREEVAALAGHRASPAPEPPRAQPVPPTSEIVDLEAIDPAARTDDAALAPSDVVFAEDAPSALSAPDAPADAEALAPPVEAGDAAGPVAEPFALQPSTAEPWGSDPDPGEMQPEAAAPLDPPPQEPADDASLDDLLAPEPTPAPSAPAPRSDYLSVARRAAQSAGAAKTATRARRADQGGFDLGASLRGRGGMIAMTAAGVAIAAVAGGLYFAGRTAPADRPASPNAAASAPRPVDVPARAPDGSIAAALGAAPVRAGPIETLEAAAARGEPIALYELGVSRLAAGDAGGGLEMIRKAADAGLAIAQHRLAKAYDRGETGARDLPEARRFSERAAEGGNIRAMHDLGVFYARGEGGPKDEAAAFRWFRQAAGLGVVDSQFNLGVMYEKGQGAPVDLVEALFWFKVAAAGGDKEAADRAAAFSRRLSATAIAGVEERAKAFVPGAADPIANGAFGARAWSPAAPNPGSNAAPAR